MNYYNLGKTFGLPCILVLVKAHDDHKRVFEKLKVEIFD